MAPSQDPELSCPPSLQSIQDAGPNTDGYISPMLSMDWSEQAPAGSVVDPLHLEPVFDVCGVGQCLIDINVRVKKEMLQELNVPHGGRRVIGVEERDSLLRQLEQVPSAMSGAGARTLSMFNLNNVTPGGSLLNTLIGISRLGAAASGSRPLRVAMAGSVGGEDRLGTYVRQQLRAAGVDVVKPEDGEAAGAGGGAEFGEAQQTLGGRRVITGPQPGGAAQSHSTTGTVMVFCTPDAQRSFLSCIPKDQAVEVAPELLKAAARSRLLVIEGYLLDQPGAAASLPALVEASKAAGTVVALTLGDAGVVRRSSSTIAACLAQGVDLVFSNAGEALALMSSPEVRALLVEEVEREKESRKRARREEGRPGAAATYESEDDEAVPPARNAAEAAEQLARLCPMVVVTDGSRGSYVSALGQTQVFPPRWSKSAPVDTCGAGDNYAAGLLYGLLRGLDISQVGQIAAHTASAVIARHGPQLDQSDARRVVLSAARCSAASLSPSAASPAGPSLMSILEARALLAREERLSAERDAAATDDDDDDVNTATC